MSTESLWLIAGLSPIFLMAFLLLQNKIENLVMFSTGLVICVWGSWVVQTKTTIAQELLLGRLLVWCLWACILACLIGLVSGLLLKYAFKKDLP